MATANTADAWRHGGQRPERSYPSARAPMPARAMNSERAPRPGRPGGAQPLRPADRARAAESRTAYGSGAVDFPRAPARRASEPPRAAARGAERGPSARPVAPRATAAPRPRSTEGGGRVPGIVAVLGMFVVTLAGAGIDSFVGIGLGLVTLGALCGATAVATWVVRRRDLPSVIVAPPLVFVAVAAFNIGLAPSAHFNLPTIATLLVRGFPTMAMATGVALLLTLVRLAARR
ncbi:MAG: DUF6542 domain-containing protein [Blastococcus sp.]